MVTVYLEVVVYALDYHADQRVFVCTFICAARAGVVSCIAWRLR